MTRKARYEIQFFRKREGEWYVYTSDITTKPEMLAKFRKLQKAYAGDAKFRLVRLTETVLAPKGAAKGKR